MADEEKENEDSKETSILTETSESNEACNSTEVAKKDETMSSHSLNSSTKDEKGDLQQDRQNEISFKVPSGINKEIKPQDPVNEPKKENVPELRYRVPWWSATPLQTDNYNLELLKNGCIISTVDLNDKPYHVFGRLPLCDVVLEHPSLSRYHAVIQYRAETDGDKSLSGFYIYDLGSTHGTLVNKVKIKPKTYYRLKIGYVIKFGGSSRLFVLQGPADDDDNEMNEELTPVPTSENKTTGNVGQIFTDEEYKSLKKVEEKSEQSEGIDWGFGEDAEEEHIDSEKFEELYSGVEFKDPKKTLRGYYEREGLELEYIVDETGPGHARVYHCRVRLPVDGPNGSAVYAEASVTGRKKEAVKECANEACKMLDAYGLLRQSNHESRKKRERNWEEDDFYESDEDNFLDRTGVVEKKRLKRMRKAGKEKSSDVETYDSLLEKLLKVQEVRKGLEKQISDQEGLQDTDDKDSLDNFMNTISHSMDKETKIKLKRRIIELRKDEKNIEKLVSLAKPTDLPSLQSAPRTNTTTVDKPDNISGNQDLPKKQNEKKESGNDVEKTNEKDESSSEKLEEKPDLIATSTSKTFNEFAMPIQIVKRVKSKKISKTLDNGGDMKREVVEENGKKLVNKDTGKKEMIKEPSENMTSKEESSENMTSKEEKDETKDKLKVVKKKKRYSAPTQWEDANDPNFANWVPPQDQSGDGRTKLNDKYGY